MRIVLLALAMTALWGQESKLTVSDPAWNGLEVRFLTKVEPPGENAQARLPGAIIIEQGRAHHLIHDAAHKRTFGYDVWVTPETGGNTVQLRIAPMKFADGKPYSVPPGWTLIELPKYPVIPKVQIGDTVALDLLVNPGTGQKIVDYLTVARQPVRQEKSATLAAPPRAGGQKQQPATSTAERVVEVSLVATGSNGAPVTDLRSDEIRITDNGKTQKIASFEKLKADSLYYVVVFDTMSATYLDQPSVRLELLSTLGELGSGDRSYVLVLHIGLRLLHDYNAESPALLRKLVQQRGAQPLPTSAESLAAFSWVFDDIGPLNLFSPTTITQSRWNDQTLEAITTLAAKIGRLQGRKNLIWIGTGLLMSPEASEFHIRNGEVFSSPDGNTPYRFHRQIEMAARALNNVDMAFYAVDARPFTLGNPGITDMGTMRDLARMTGGMAYPDRNNTVKSTVREALDDSREAYLLTYSPTGFKADGKYHRIEVQTSRGDNVKLRHRDGYNATNP